jgi:hypothetical protein
MRLLIAAALIPVLASAALAQREYNSGLHGYSITIPEEWNAADNDFLRAFSRAISARGDNIRYVGAFQAAGFAEGLDYPYVLVQAIRYTDLGYDGVPNLDARQEIFAEMTGMTVSDALQDSASEQARAMIAGEPGIANASIDGGTGEYTYDIQLEVVDIGAIHGRLIGKWGRQSILQAAYYAREENWPDHEAQADEILAGFHVVEGTIEPEKTNNPVISGALRGAAIGGAIIGAIVIAIIGLLVVALRKFSA